MQDDKYGFVYVWFDHKHKRYYVGCRWGNEHDSYVCSSNWMKQAYARRPQDFKRRVIARVTTSRSDLLIEEHKWLSMIKDEELGKKYYNLTNHKNGSWSADPDKLREVGAKISRANRGKKRTEEAIANQKAGMLKRKLEGKPRYRVTIKRRPPTEETRKKMSAAKLGTKCSIPRKFPVEIIFLDGRSIISHSIKVFAEESGISRHTLHGASCKGTQLPKHNIASVKLLNPNKAKQ